MDKVSGGTWNGSIAVRFRAEGRIFQFSLHSALVTWRKPAGILIFAFG